LLTPLLLTHDVNPAGAYIIRLCHAGQWRAYLVDDLLPCRNDRSLAYIVSHRQQLWAPLLEKAYAKMHGSYEALIGGQMYEAMGALTGSICDVEQLYRQTREDAWTSVRTMLDRGFLLCTDVRSNADAEVAKSFGLVTRHAYSVLRAHESGAFRLVELRNPHGRGVWKGDWSDLSRSWDQPGAPNLPHDGVHQKPATGRFWISFEDFICWFGSVQYCKVRPDGWHDERLDVSVSPPDLVGFHGRALTFTLPKPAKLEAAMLQVGGRGRGCSREMADVGFVILRCSQGGKGGGRKGKGGDNVVMTIAGRSYELVVDCPRRQHGCVAIEADLEPGEYVAIPVVLCGRRAAKPGSGQDRATFVLQTYPPVQSPFVVDGLAACTIQRDLLILRMMRTGVRHCGTEGGGDVYVLNDPSGHTIIARNVSAEPIRVTIDAKKSLRCESSRGAVTTTDVIMPGCVQVLVVFTFGIHFSGPKSLSWTSSTSILRHGAADRRAPHEPALPEGSGTKAFHEPLSFSSFLK